MRPTTTGLALIAALAMAGCAKEPEPPRQAAITLSAGPGINPTPDGTPTPVVVHLYELKQISAFAKADFFDVTDQPQATLGTDLVSNERITLRPGDSVTRQWVLDDATRHVGAVAAFRDLDHARWQASAAMPPGVAASAYAVGVSGTAIDIAAK